MRLFDKDNVVLWESLLKQLFFVLKRSLKISNNFKSMVKVKVKFVPIKFPEQVSRW